MSSDFLSSWVALFGSAVSLLGLFQSRPSLVGIGAGLLVISLGAIGYAIRQRRFASSGNLVVEDRSIDSLGLANLKRRIDHALMVQDVDREILIEGENLRIRAKYSGYCRADYATAIEFSIDSDRIIPFDSLECYGFDLVRDAGKKRPIQPILLSSDGSAKKIALPFQQPLVSGDPFAVLLICKLPGCMASGVDYYAATLSFNQARVPQHRVSLNFAGGIPDWVRVYEYSEAGSLKLLKDLPSLHRTNASVVYEDRAADVNGRSSRIYLFRRSVTAVGFGRRSESTAVTAAGLNRRNAA